MVTTTMPQKTNLKYEPETYESTTLGFKAMSPGKIIEYERLIFVLSGQKYLHVFMEKMEDGYWIATSTQIDTYGTGETQQDALDNLRNELKLYYSELLSDEDNLKSIIYLKEK